MIKTFFSGDLNKHKSIHTGEKNIQMLNLSEHKRIHSGEKSFKCSVCDKGIGRRGHLKMQMRTHSDEKTCVQNVIKRLVRMEIC